MAKASSRVGTSAALLVVSVLAGCQNSGAFVPDSEPGPGDPGSRQDSWMSYVITAPSPEPAVAEQQEAAALRAEWNPARPEDARNSVTADLNHDSFVTLDELVALWRAGRTGDQILGRLHRTGQTFQLTDEQQRYLTDRWLDPELVARISHLKAGPEMLPGPNSPRRDVTAEEEQ